MKNMKNNKLEQAFKNIAKTATEARPVLQCLHVDKKGYAVVTDAHRLLRIEDYKDTSDTETSYNLNLMNFQLYNDMQYPDTERIIPEQNIFSWPFSIEAVKNLVAFFKPFKVRKNYDDASLITITCKDYYITFTAGNGEAIVIDCSTVDGGNCGKMNIVIQGGYLSQAFDFFKDYGYGVTVGYGGNLRPLLFKAAGATYMITPVRKF